MGSAEQTAKVTPSPAHSPTPSVNSTTASYSQLALFLWPAALSLVSGILLTAFEPPLPESLASLSQALSVIIPGIGEIAKYTTRPSTAKLLMTCQWVFLFWYLGIWFGRIAPWKPNIRSATARKAATLRPGQRVVFVIGYLVLLAYLLGDLQLIGFPTLLNSKFAYPPASASLLLRPIYKSNAALLVYAWISPFCEATILWMIANFTINLPAYLGLRKT